MILKWSRMKSSQKLTRMSLKLATILNIVYYIATNKAVPTAFKSKNAPKFDNANEDQNVAVSDTDTALQNANRADIIVTN